MADTAQPIGGLNDAGALQDADLIEIERPGDPPLGLRGTIAAVAVRVLAKLLAGSGIRVTSASGNLTISSGGAASVEVTGSATLALTHADRFVRCNSASAITLTVPAQSTVAWPDDIQIEGAQWGAGTVTFVGASGVTIRKSDKIAATTGGQYSPWGLKRVAANEWLLFGQMASP